MVRAVVVTEMKLNACKNVVKSFVDVCADNTNTIAHCSRGGLMHLHEHGVILPAFRARANAVEADERFEFRFGFGLEYKEVSMRVSG